MRISGTGPTTPSSKVKKTDKKSDGGSFGSQVSSASEGTAPPTGATDVNMVAPVNNLFMIQEMNDEQPSNSKAYSSGITTLDYLEDIRLGLLTGKMPEDAIRKLETKIKSWRESTNDPKLNEILDEIELRAAVEIAKLRK